MAILFLIFLDQICPKWIKLDQIGFLTNQKEIAIKSCHIYHGEKNHHYIFDQIGSQLSKMDQT